MSDKPLSAVEGIKARSRLLRGTIVEGLADPVTGAISEDDTQLIKFHGSYQQDDRDLREERRLQKLEPAYSFMIRTRLPGGVCTPRQWLAMDEIARRYGNGTLRLTTRQAFQLHGVLKRNVKAARQSMDAVLVDSRSACGDVNRNVQVAANPVPVAAHAEVFGWGVKLSEHLLPHTRAYQEIWLDQEPLAGSEEETILGSTYLPRKFKIGIAVPPDNDVDVFANDLGFIAILTNGHLAGFNLAVGGGMGMTHGDAATWPRVADVIGFVKPAELLEVAETVVKIQRDFGDRSDRKHARLKYTIADRGVDWFRAELFTRLKRELPAPRPFEFTSVGDRFGWTEGQEGRWHLTLRIESGRVADGEGAPHLTGLREIAKLHQGDFRITPNQNLVIADVPAEARAPIDALTAQYALDGYRVASPVRRDALACVALPTCALAMAEAERYLPHFLTRVEQLLAAHGLADQELLLRITGCPNGCARPFLSEIALVGKAPGRYNLYLGGDERGQRLNQLYRENIDEATILAALDELFGHFSRERLAGERLGAFALRLGYVGAAT
jgi:sulfite reductase (NADPH) hemoprotein beta-component